MKNKDYLKLAVFGSIFLGLAACASPDRIIQVRTEPVERATLTLPQVDVLRQDRVDWIVYSRRAEEGEIGSLEYLHERMDERNTDSAFVLTPEYYENLSVNIERHRQLSTQLRAQIRAYRDYYENQQALIDRHNERAIVNGTQ